MRGELQPTLASNGEPSVTIRPPRADSLRGGTLGSTDAAIRACSKVAALLDATEASLLGGDARSMSRLVVRLNAIRQQVTVAVWRELTSRLVRPHSVNRLLFEDPLTRRAYEKPRGYAGDAPMLDLIYSGAPVHDLSELGAQLHAWMRAEPAARSVRLRRDILAALIDDAARGCRAPRILSVACGHLREAQRSEAVRSRAVEELVALDQDAESLAVVDREQRQFNVTPLHASIHHLISGKARVGTFDVIYAAGLFDYLNEAAARALIDSLFDALRPGGTLLVANFAPDVRDIGYMEAIMDWRLIYRDETDLARLVPSGPTGSVVEHKVFRDRPGNIVYLTLRRA